MKQTVKTVIQSLMTGSMSAVQRFELIPLGNNEKRLKIMAKLDGDTCKIDTVGSILKVGYDNKRYTIDVIRDRPNLQRLLNTFRGDADETTIFLNELLPYIILKQRPIVITKRTQTVEDQSVLTVEVAFYAKKGKKSLTVEANYVFNEMLGALQVLIRVKEKQEVVYLNNLTIQQGTETGQHALDIRREVYKIQKYLNTQ